MNLDSTFHSVTPSTTNFFGLPTSSPCTVVEITPIGIQTLGWRFYIIWIVFNAAFLPIIYLFYPETADRSLEDMDRLFRENHDIFIYKYNDAIAPHRPAAYSEHEVEEMRRNSSVDPRTLRKAVGKVTSKADEDRALEKDERDPSEGSSSPA